MIMAESLGIVSFALQLMDIATKVYVMSSNLRNNSKRCESLGENCRLLSEALSKYSQKRTLNDCQMDEEYKTFQKLKDVLRRCLRYVIRTSANKFSYNLWEILFIQEYEKLEDELAKYLSYFQLSVQIHTANASDDVKQITLENNSYIKDVRRIMDDKLIQDFTKIFIKDLKLKPIENEPSKFRSDYKGQPVIASEVSYQISDNIDAAADPGSDSSHSIRRSVAILQKLANLGSVHGSYGLYRQNGRVYVVTEDLPCGSLTEVLKKGKLREKMKQKIEIAREIAYTLAYIHASGIIHKSICCDNIYMTKDLRPKVSNFVYGREVRYASTF
ncbi:kinase-like domain-containing protein [Glomus cerebriforme]|uniref:Kinase-like domain-containing protein n=1 Tax=Glomus cerebriforme TaxID=658196 RepID=A0A397TMA5_9GLOM|nr:kinase-like domain-containing protein [Glomus cerebriforme]